MEDVAASLELITCDPDIGKENGNGAEHAGSLVVTGFEQVRQRELSKFAGTRRNEVDEKESNPSTCGQPERGEPVAIGVLGSRKQRTGANPRREQRQNKDERGQRTAGNKIIGFGLYARCLIDGDCQENGHDDGQHCNVELGHPVGLLQGGCVA